MNAHASLLGLHQPREGWLLRPGVGWKYPLMPTLSLLALIIQAQPATLAALALAITLLASSGIDLARMLRIRWAMWLILGPLAAYQLMVLNPQAVVVVLENLLLAALIACLLILTTPTLELSNTLVVALRPTRFAGLNPGRVALAVVLMICSTPYLLDLFDDARDAARAREAERSVVMLPIPMVLGSVTHTERTGEALAARGFGEREQ